MWSHIMTLSTNLIGITVSIIVSTISCWQIGSNPIHTSTSWSRIRWNPFTGSGLLSIVGWNNISASSWIREISTFLIVTSSLCGWCIRPKTLIVYFTSTNGLKRSASCLLVHGHTILILVQGTEYKSWNFTSIHVIITDPSTTIPCLNLANITLISIDWWISWRGLSSQWCACFARA